MAKPSLPDVNGSLVRRGVLGHRRLRGRGQPWRDGGQCRRRGTWTVQSSGTDNLLNAIACPSAGRCLAVGRYGTILAGSPAQATWAAGTPSPSPTRAPTPVPTGTPEPAPATQWHARRSGATTDLYAITCPTSTMCLAGGGAPVTSWSAPMPEPPGTPARRRERDRARLSRPQFLPRRAGEDESQAPGRGAWRAVARSLSSTSRASPAPRAAPA